MMNVLMTFSVSTRGVESWGRTNVFLHGTRPCKGTFLYSSGGLDSTRIEKQTRMERDKSGATRVTTR